MNWERDSAGWPNRDASRFVIADHLRWHVQVMGSGPVVILAHGTGASTHSWRDLAPILAQSFTVVAPDLPGHGFTEIPVYHRLSLPAMARGLTALLGELRLPPALAIGHSAGAAVLARMMLDGGIAPSALIGLNAALQPIEGMHGTIFSALAKMLVGLPPVPRFFASRAADRRVVDRLLKDTGSTLDAAGADLYAKLARDPGHVGAALGMMANWDLHPLRRDITRLATPTILVAGSADRTISPNVARRLAPLMPNAEAVILHGLGHLAHEEAPERTADLILECARHVGVLPSG